MATVWTPYQSKATRKSQLKTLSFHEGGRKRTVTEHNIEFYVSCWQNNKTITAIYKATYSLLLLVLQCLHFQFCHRETHILTRSVWVWVEQCLCTYVIIKVRTNSSAWYTSAPYEIPDLYERVYTLCDKHCVILVWGRD